MAGEESGHLSPYRDRFRRKNHPGTATEWVEKIVQGDVVALSKAITLLESRSMEDRRLADDILKVLPASTGHSLRMGVTGIPGAGKSTFIEAIAGKWAEKGIKTAVLAVDPSSHLAGGSILGDKTRMEELSRHANVYIRPTPSSGTLGGVAAATRETIMLCEAAGYHTIFVETVGVGQSEVDVHSMVDLFLLLAIPGAGDELQGIKRGIMEMADVIIVNKAEGDNLEKARMAARQIENALHLFPANAFGLTPEVFQCSSIEKSGLEEIYRHVLFLDEKLQASGMFEKRRSGQALIWFHETLKRQLIRTFYETPAMKNEISVAEQKVANGEQNPYAASEEILRHYLQCF